MSENRKVQIPVVVDATGAKDGFEAVKQGGRDMAQALQQSAQQAAGAVDKIGAGAVPAAAKLDGATRSIIGSIQRTTAVMEAGERGSVKYFEALAAQRGVSADVLKPYLAQLEAVQGKQAAANAAISAGAGAMNSTALSAKQLQFALRGVPAQFTDIATSLASGQRPLQVLLQQGGQLKDMFGGIGPAARALGGYVLGLINPLTIGAAALGAIAFAAHAGSEELRGFQNAATLTGGAIGVSASRFGELRDSIAGIAGTKGKAAEALTAIAASGLNAGDSVRSIAEAAILMEKATGQAISKTVEQFKELQKTPADAAAKLNEQYNFLTASVYRQIKALEDQGRALEAANLAERTYADAIKTRAQTVVDNAGYIEKAWRGIIATAKGAWDAMLGVGREITPTQQLADAAAKVARIQAQIAGVGTFADTGGGAAVGGASAGRRAALEKDLALAKQAQREAQRRVEIEANNTAQKAEQNRLQALGIDFLKQGDQFLTKAQQREKELTRARIEGQQLVNAGIITEADLRARLAGIREKFKESGAAGTGESEVAAIRARIVSQKEVLARLQKQLATGDFSEPAELTQGEQARNKILKELETTITGKARAEKLNALAVAESAIETDKAVEAQKRQNKAYQDAEEAVRKQSDAVGQQADAIRQQAIGQEAANAQFGKSKTAIEESTLALLKLQLAQADSSDTFDPRYVAGLRAKTEAQQKFVEALQQSEFLQKSRSLDEAGRVAGEEAQTLQLEMSLLGRSQQEREKIIAQRRVEVALAKELSEIEKLNLGTGPEADAKRQEQKDKARSNARVQAANAEQKTLLDEWQRTADSINNSLTDALLRGFESGKDFASNFRDTLKNMFSTMVLRPIIQAVMSPVSGALAGIGQQIGGSIVGGGGGILGGIGSAGGMLGALGSGLGMFGQAAGVSVSNGLIGGFGANMANIGELASGGEILGALGAAAPYLAIGALAVGLLSKPGGGPKTESGFGPGVPTRGDPATAKTVADAITAQYKAIAGQLAQDLQVGVFSATDPKGTAQTQLAVNASLNGQQISDRGARLGGIENVGRSEAELAAAITEESNRVVLKALADTGLPDKIGAYLKQLGDIDKLSGGALETAVQKLQKAMTERQGLEQQYFDLTHTELERLTAARQKERAAIDDTNQALYDTVAALTDLRTAETQARDALMSAYQSESDALRGVIDRHTGYAKQLREVRDSLSLSPQAPISRAERAARAGNVFTGTLSSAVAGNEDALQGLGEAGKAFIEAARAAARTPAEVAAAIARVQAGLTTAASSADGRASTAQQQLDAMTQQLTALGLLNTSVLSVGEALAQFLKAQAAIQTETLRYTAEIAAMQGAAGAGDAAVSAIPPAAAPTTSLADLAAQYDAGVIRSRGPGDFYNRLTGAAIDFEQLRRAVNFGDGGFTVTGFASGGLASGVVQVGEKGPEVVDLQTPGRVYTNEQTRGMFASNAALEPLLRDVSGKLGTLIDQSRVGDVAMVASLKNIDARLKKFDNVGMPTVVLP